MMNTRLLVWLIPVFLFPFFSHAGDDKLLPAMADGDEGGFARSWQVLSLKDLSLRRLAVPYGWLVSEETDGAFPRNLVFLPDRDYSWRAMPANQWERLELQGSVLFRLKVPSGWLVRETLAVSSGQSPVRTLVFVPDPRHGWQPRPPGTKP